MLHLITCHGPVILSLAELLLLGALRVKQVPFTVKIMGNFENRSSWTTSAVRY